MLSKSVPSLVAVGGGLEGATRVVLGGGDFLGNGWCVDKFLVVGDKL